MRSRPKSKTKKNHVATLETIEKSIRRNTLPDSGYIRAAPICACFSISNVTLWRWIRKHGFPALANTFLNVRRWRVEDVRAFAEKVIGGAA